MFLESGNKIAVKLQELQDHNNGIPLQLAVAYWGDRSVFLPQWPYEIVCDLESGACNPGVIRKLWEHHRKAVKCLASLHAKIAIGSTGAVVSSANISVNGLGAKGLAARNHEAGYFVSVASTAEYSAITAWFKRIWNDAREIDESDLKLAEEKWNERQRMKLKLKDIDATKVPHGSIGFLDLLGNFEGDSVLRSVTSYVLGLSKSLFLSETTSQQCGKVASRACYLISAENKTALEVRKGGGTNLWMPAQTFLELESSNESQSIRRVAMLLHAIAVEPAFTSGVRSAARIVLGRPNWAWYDATSSLETEPAD